MTAEATSSAKLLQHLDCLSRYVNAIPDRLRTFDVAQHAARIHFGLEGSTLDQLCSAGFPYFDGPSGRQYSLPDLHFIALRSERVSAYRRSVMAWANTTAQLGSRDSTLVEVSLLPQESVDNALIVLPDRTISQAVRANVEAAVIAATQLEQNTSLPTDVRDLLIRIAKYDFYLLPDGVPDRIELARALRAGDCGSVAGVLCQDLKTLGYESCIKFGLLISVPYSTPHFWTEVMVDGRRVALDPLMISVMTRFGGLDAEAWPPDRPLNAAVIGIAEVSAEGSPLPIISEAGVAIPTTFLTTIRGTSDGFYPGTPP